MSGDIKRTVNTTPLPEAVIPLLLNGGVKGQPLSIMFGEHMT